MSDPGLPQIVDVRVTATKLIVSLADGRQVATPLSWYPTLARASKAQRDRVEITPFGIHWPDLDEDLSLAGMLAAQNAARRAVL